MQAPEAYTGVENLEVMQEAENYNRYLLETVRKHAPAHGRVIDFGAGGGQFAAPLAALGFDVTAVEPDDLLLRRLRDQKVRAVAAPAELPDGAFEYAYTLNVLEHIEDDVGALRELHAKLSDRGRLLVYVPAFPILYTSMDARVKHIRRYTRKTLVQAVEAAHFRVEKAAYVDSLGFFATLLFKLVGSSSGNVNPRALRLYDRFVFPLSRILDALVHRWFGKNVLLIASKR